MYQTTMAGTGQPFADWVIEFATDRIGIAYTPRSRYASEITQDNWYDILSRPDVMVGLSDPRFDPCGYRAMMVTQLAEAYYRDDSIFERVFGNRFTYSVTVGDVDGAYTIVIPQILEPWKNASLLLRTASVQLLALLDSGDLDYAFEYASVAEQHGLKFLELPPRINLGSQEHAADYARVRVGLEFQRFASVTPRFGGEPIIYGLTIPANAPHPDLAAEFVAFLVGPEGQAIMERNYHPTIAPPRADNVAALPAALRGLIQ